MTDCIYCGLPVESFNDCIVIHDECVEKVPQLRQRVAELEAKLSQTWQPVEEDTKFGMGHGLTISFGPDGDMLVNDGGAIAVVVLPDNYRLCRLVK